jgi:hypothetical protein
MALMSTSWHWYLLLLGNNQGGASFHPSPFFQAHLLMRLFFYRVRL